MYLLAPFVHSVANFLMAVHDILALKTLNRGDIKISTVTVRTKNDDNLCNVRCRDFQSIFACHC